MSTLLDSIVNSFIVKPTGAPGYIGSQGFIFDILGDEEVSLDSDITDHYVEENYAVQDHIALRAPKFTLTGYIGELNDVLQNKFLNILTSIQSMAGIGSYTMSFGAQATQVYNAVASAVSQVTTVVNQAQNIYNTIGNPSTSETRQQSAYNAFVTLYMNRTLCVVETPWATWTDMGIESIRILQRDANKMVSEFSVTFKQIRKVMPTYTTIASQVWQDGRAAMYTSPYNIVAGDITGQTVLPDGTIVDMNLLKTQFSGAFGVSQS